MTEQNDNEAAMIASILAGDTQLYHDLIRPHERSVYMMALSFVKNEADGEDIARGAFLRGFLTYPQFRGKPGSVPGSSASHSTKREAYFGDRRSFAWNHLPI